MGTPRLGLTVIRSAAMERAVAFYEALGLAFSKHRHGKGPEHYAYEGDGPVFEIYPLSEGGQATTAVRIGFEVSEVDSLLPELVKQGGEIKMKPKDSEWGRRAVLLDRDGHTVELVSPAERDMVAASD